MVYPVPFTPRRNEFRQIENFQAKIAGFLSYSLSLCLNGPFFVET